jgi:hypothetical protein
LDKAPNVVLHLKGNAWNLLGKIGGGVGLGLGLRVSRLGSKKGKP